MLTKQEFTPLRGFANNSRNGSNAFVANAEIRVPVWSTIFKLPANNDFLRHLQFVGFADVGSVGQGFTHIQKIIYLTQLW